MSSLPVNRLAPLRRSRSKAGFTLVEIILAAAITVILVGILLRITTLASSTVNLSTQALTAFSSARSAFDIMTQNLSQATLNTYLDYYDATGNRRTNADISTFQPVSFGRASDLEFVVQQNQQNSAYGQEVYFQAPRAYSTDANIQSISGLLNACGYYITFGNNQAYEPAIVSSMVTSGTMKEKYRYRLMQAMEPTEKLQVFTATAGASSTTAADQASKWLVNIKNPPAQSSVYITPLADNVIALVVWPKLSSNNDPTGLQLLPSSVPTYTYDSQTPYTPLTTPPYKQPLTYAQLPPDLQITMVVLDEASAARLAAASATASAPPTAIETALSGKFQRADYYSSDLSTLATVLSAQHLNFQFFSTTVALRESKWSTPQN